MSRPEGATSVDQALGQKVIVSVLGQEELYTVKYTLLPDGVPKGEARGNS